MNKYLQAYNGLPLLALLAFACFGVARCAHADDAVIQCKEFKPGEITCIITGSVSDITPPSESI